MMFTSMMKAFRRTGREEGFTLVELLIVILIVGILAAVAIPLYLGYTKDAKLAEGKALLGSVMTALQGCVQAKGSGQSCSVSEIVNRVGVSTAGVTGDGRWTVTTSGSLAVSSTSPPTFSGTIQAAGTGADTAALSLGMFPTTTGVFLRCNSSSSTPPSGPTAGEPC
ncbi:MAG TPA: prepilin-type N-terminal cleavage/methylation domain-containing protein [Pseudomonadales bacterium]|nr:prepilin-type N-terminal cleavage/methylation domain-containing protein [Pseudomonadales bacterium]